MDKQELELQRHKKPAYLTDEEYKQRVYRAKYMNEPSDDTTDYTPTDEKIAGEIKPYEEGKERMPPEMEAQKIKEKEALPHPLVRTKYYGHHNKVLKQKLPQLRKELEAEGGDVRLRGFLEDKNND